MCIMCEVEKVNQGQLGKPIDDNRPGYLEHGMAGLGIAFAAWGTIAVFGGIAALVQKYEAGTASLVICLVTGFLAGVWARNRD